MSNIIKKQLKIDGMHCSSCAMSIDFDLEDLDGVHAVKTNYARAQTEIEFDETKIDLSTILKQIQKSGYRVSIEQGSAE